MTADQRLKAPVLHAINNRKLVTAEFTAATRQSSNNLRLAKSFVGDFYPRLIRKSLIYARFSAVGNGVGLYASIYAKT